jgi:glycosyltransferase involved in cell wall biosynthesis
MLSSAKNTLTAFAGSLSVRIYAIGSASNLTQLKVSTCKELMKDQKIAILHYSAPPIIGGVEAVISAHLNEFIRAGYSCTVIAGRGDVSAFPPMAKFVEIPEIDSQHPEIIKMSRELERGQVPENYEAMETELTNLLHPILGEFDHLIIHNIFTKHFNLPLTGALHRLLDQDVIQNGIAWCHDFTWTSPSSRSKVHPGYPWDLLRTKRSDCTYITVSKERQHTLAELFECPVEEIGVVYNGVDPVQTIGLSDQGMVLVDHLGLLKTDINILMPVRVTQAKNIEFALEVVASLKKRELKPKLIVTGPPDPHDSKSMSYYQSLKDLREDLEVVNEMRFVFESGPDPEQPFYIDMQVVGDLFRISDLMFMPSHREGFGMPILEAGLVGIPIVSREVPAAQELAENEAFIFGSDADADQVATLIVQIMEQSPTARLRRFVRRNYTWRAIFEEEIKPLLTS